MITEDQKIKLENFFAKYKAIKYKKGELILKPGEEIKYVCFSKNGFIRMYTLNDSGQEITLLFFRPLFYFTMMFSFAKLSNKFYFEANTPVEVHQAPIDEVRKFFLENEDIFRSAMGIAITGLIGQLEQLSTMMAKDSYSKVASVVYILAERSEKSDGVYTKINFGITHKLIASLTGLTRETVTLQMLRLEKEGLIKNANKKVVVLDEERLMKVTRQGS